MSDTIDVGPVLGWFFHVVDLAFSEQVADALLEEYEEEFVILADLPIHAVRRIALETRRRVGDSFSPAHWLEAARHDTTLARVLAFERARFAAFDDIPLPTPGTRCWWTLGWSRAFHSSPHCSALASGQEFVIWRGGEPADVVSGTANDAVFHAKKRPCKVCWIRSGGIVLPAAL